MKNHSLTGTPGPVASFVAEVPEIPPGLPFST